MKYMLLLYGGADSPARTAATTLTGLAIQDGAVESGPADIVLVDCETLDEALERAESLVPGRTAVEIRPVS